MIRLRSAIFSLCIFFQAIAFTAAADELPPIDAHRFDVKPIQKSSSGRIYLFQSGQTIPKTGNLILIYDHEKPAMAFRVLKNDFQRQTFVGKRVRRYDQTSELKINHSYSTLEKLADALPPPLTSNLEPEVISGTPVANPPAEENTISPESTSDAVPSETTDLDSTPQTTTTPNAQDSELDENTSAGLDEMDSINGGEELGSEDEEPIEYEESTQLDPFNNIASVSAGYIANGSNFTGSPVFNNGFSLSYAHKMFRDVFISKKASQDSLSLELGAIHYRIINKDGNNDLYSMLPFYANLFYQLNTSSTFSFNVYLGLQYNYMTSATNPAASVSSLQGFQPNVGIGALFALGPQWFLRTDLGWDRITGGLSIKW